MEQESPPPKKIFFKEVCSKVILSERTVDAVVGAFSSL
jgi:hypothetical protein